MACVTGALGQPQLEWQVSSAPAVKPVGYSTTFTGWEAASPYRAQYGPAVVAEAGQAREESGRDWWQAHCNLADGGYVTAGYTSYVNWLPDDGCPKPTGTYPAYKDGIATFFMEREDRRQSATRQAMARYDAMGTLVWYKTFAMGAFSDVVQDHEGNLVAAGSSMDLKATADVPVHSIYFNPAASSPGTTVAQYQCTPDRQRKMSVMKLDGDGNILWDHLYHHEDNILDALDKKSEAHGLIETFLNGTYGYRVVGYGAQNTGNGTPWRLFVVDLDGDGLVEGKTLHTAGVPGSVDAEGNATIGGGMDGGTGDETKPFVEDKHSTAYAISKAGAELEVHRGIAEGLHAVMVNPCVVIGPGKAGRSSMTMIERIRKGTRFFPAGSNAVVDARDVATAMTRLITEGETGERYLLIGENLPYRKLFTLIAASASRSSPSLLLPKWALELGWRAEALRTVFGGRPLITKHTARTASRTRKYDESKAEHLLGMRFRNAEEAVANVVVFLAVP